MKTGKEAFPQPVRKSERSKIPVDNREFSTFSTGFSTGVFHSLFGLWEKCGIDIKEADTLRRNPHFFSGRKNYHRGRVCAKNQDLTGSGAVRNQGAVPGRVLGRRQRRTEIFLKRGLILGGKNAIMCNCMKITEEEVP
ncbi:MAG: hypothetical protein SPI15_00280 [Candidatus Faecousia sp.]|nr:hypothetical protein [Candidatus Faecousia sp.]